MICFLVVLSQTGQFLFSAEHFVLLLDQQVNKRGGLFSFSSLGSVTICFKRQSFYSCTISLQNLLGIIYENENQTDGIQRVLQELHEKCVPFAGNEDNAQYSNQEFAADQLSLERGVNCLLHLQNGFTPKERLQGIYFEIADFHGRMKFLRVSKTNKSRL